MLQVVWKMGKVVHLWDKCVQSICPKLERNRQWGEIQLSLSCGCEFTIRICNTWSKVIFNMHSQLHAAIGKVIVLWQRVTNNGPSPSLPRSPLLLPVCRSHCIWIVGDIPSLEMFLPPIFFPSVQPLIHSEVAKEAFIPIAASSRGDLVSLRLSIQTNVM